MTDGPLLPQLSPRQNAVAQLVADGFSDKQIATRLNLAPRSVHVYITRIAKKLGADGMLNTRVQITRAVIFAWAELDEQATRQSVSILTTGAAA